MITKWTSHLKTKEEQTKFASQVLGAKPVLDRLVAVINELETSLDRSDIDAKSFDSPNWAYLQAYKNGCRAAYSALRKMTSLDQKD